MRTALANHVNQNVLVKGWIESWKIVEDKDVFRVSIKNPLIKEVDKNILFENQKLISKEDHLNIFLPKNEYQMFINYFSRFDVIHLTGRVIQYIRSNGTCDFGVDVVQTDAVTYRLHTFLEEGDALIDKHKKIGYADQSLVDHIKYSLIPQTYALEQDLKDVGEFFPSFNITYDEMMKLILDQRMQMKLTVKILEVSLNSSSYKSLIKKKKAKNKILEIKKQKGFGYSFA